MFTTDLQWQPLTDSQAAVLYDLPRDGQPYTREVPGLGAYRLIAQDAGHFTGLPRSAAVATIASTSSWEKCGAAGSSLGERNPPDDAILITSAPSRIVSRTFARAASTPSQIPEGIPGYWTSHAALARCVERALHSP